MMFLAKEDLEQMTGAKRTKYQIQWLQKNRIRYLVDINGKPQVLEAHIKEILTNNESKLKPPKEPNFAALDQLLT